LQAILRRVRRSSIGALLREESERDGSEIRPRFDRPLSPRSPRAENAQAESLGPGIHSLDSTPCRADIRFPQRWTDHDRCAPVS